MADPGFQIEEAFSLKFYSLAFRPRAFVDSRFSEKDVKHTKKTTNFKIQAEQAKNFIKIFRILKSGFPIFMMHHAKNFIFPCAVLSNLCCRSMK